MLTIERFSTLVADQSIPALVIPAVGLVWHCLVEYHLESVLLAVRALVGLVAGEAEVDR